MLKTRTWALLIAAAAVVLAAVSVRLLTTPGSGVVAMVSQDGAVLREIDLSRVESAYRFTVETADGGSNVIEVEPGRIRVAEADCPDQICVRQGWLPDSSMPIVCLPHGLIIEIRNAPETSADAVTG